MSLVSFEDIVRDLGSIDAVFDDHVGKESYEQDVAHYFHPKMKTGTPDLFGDPRKWHSQYHSLEATKKVGDTKKFLFIEIMLNQNNREYKQFLLRGFDYGDRTYANIATQFLEKGLARLHSHFPGLAQVHESIHIDNGEIVLPHSLEVETKLIRLGITLFGGGSYRFEKKKMLVIPDAARLQKGNIMDLYESAENKLFHLLMDKPEMKRFYWIPAAR